MLTGKTYYILFRFSRWLAFMSAIFWLESRSYLIPTSILSKPICLMCFLSVYRFLVFAQLGI